MVQGPLRDLDVTCHISGRYPPREVYHNAQDISLKLRQSRHQWHYRIQHFLIARSLAPAQKAALAS
jgi:hypothetical protein